MRTTARIAAFIPGASPPLVTIPIFFNVRCHPLAVAQALIAHAENKFKHLSQSRSGFESRSDMFEYAQRSVVPNYHLCCFSFT